jgi:hypothetical protein
MARYLAGKLVGFSGNKIHLTSILLREMAKRPAQSRIKAKKKKGLANLPKKTQYQEKLSKILPQ